MAKLSLTLWGMYEVQVDICAGNVVMWFVMALYCYLGHFRIL